MKVEKIIKPKGRLIKELSAFLEKDCGVKKLFSNPRNFLYFKKKFLEKTGEDTDSVLYLAYEKQKINGFVFMDFLEWDTRIFGFKAGRMRNLNSWMSEDDSAAFLSHIIDGCRQERYAHINIQIGFHDTRYLKMLEKAGFNIANIQITLITREGADVMAPGADQFLVRSGSKADLRQLEEIVKGAFGHTRFAVDNRYPKVKVDKMYFEWLKNSLSNKEQFVFVIEDTTNSRLFGACICEVDPDTEEFFGYKVGGIDLIFLSRDYRNKGLGQLFTKSILSWFKAKADRVEIRTQASNYPAIKAFMNAGFGELTPGIIMPAGISMHCWF